MTPHDIVQRIGKAKLSAALGIQVQAVEQALARNSLPAAWYVWCCRALGEELPPDAFRFKGLSK